MTHSLRIIGDGALGGEENMRRDLELFLHYREGNMPPHLRLYTWSRPTLSLGRFQDEQERLSERCRSLGIGVVRRPTGGRAVLHGPWELTYCFVGGPRDGLPGDLRGAYRWVLGVICSALALMGFEASVGCERASRPASGEFSCFSSATRADLLVGGKKVCGSAQRREGGDFLQHGSILIELPEWTEEDLSQASVTLSRRSAGCLKRGALSEIAGRPIRRSELEGALIECWERAARKSIKNTGGWSEGRMADGPSSGGSSHRRAIAIAGQSSKIWRASQLVNGPVEEGG